MVGTGNWHPRLFVVLVLLMLMATPALAAEGVKTSSEFLFVAQLALLMFVGRLLGELMIRLRQPAVMGQLLAGLALGPSVLGALFPDLQHAIFPTAKEQKAMLDAVAQLGCLLYCCSPAWKPICGWCGGQAAHRRSSRSLAS